MLVCNIILAIAAVWSIIWSIIQSKKTIKFHTKTIEYQRRLERLDKLRSISSELSMSFNHNIIPSFEIALKNNKTDECGEIIQSAYDIIGLRHCAYTICLDGYLKEISHCASKTDSTLFDVFYGEIVDEMKKIKNEDCWPFIDISYKNVNQSTKAVLERNHECYNNLDLEIITLSIVENFSYSIYSDVLNDVNNISGLYNNETIGSTDLSNLQLSEEMKNIVETILGTGNNKSPKVIVMKSINARTEKIQDLRNNLLASMMSLFNTEQKSINLLLK